MKQGLCVAESGSDAGESRIEIAGRQAVMSLFESLLAGAIMLTVFSLPLSESLKKMAYGVTLAAYVALIVIGGSRQVILSSVAVLFLISLTVAIASALASVDPRQAWRGTWDVFRYTSFFFLVCRGIRGEKWVLAFLAAGVLGVELPAVLVLGRSLVFGLTIHHFTMFSLGNKNAVAQYLAMMLSVMFGMADQLHMGRRGTWSLSSP